MGRRRYSGSWRQQSIRTICWTACCTDDVEATAKQETLRRQLERSEQQDHVTMFHMGESPLPPPSPCPGRRRSSTG